MKHLARQMETIKMTKHFPWHFLCHQHPKDISVAGRKRWAEPVFCQDVRRGTRSSRLQRDWPFWEGVSARLVNVPDWVQADARRGRLSPFSLHFWCFIVMKRDNGLNKGEKHDDGWQTFPGREASPILMGRGEDSWVKVGWNPAGDKGQSVSGG